MMMDADVKVRCNAGYGEVTPERVNSQNGYRRSGTPGAGTAGLAIPKLRTGSYFPSFASTTAGPNGRWPRSWRPVTC
jgi:putative transposase